MNAVAEGLKLAKHYDLPEEEVLSLLQVSTGDSQKSVCPTRCYDWELLTIGPHRWTQANRIKFNSNLN